MTTSATEPTRERLVIAALASATVAPALGTSVANVALPAISDAFGATPTVAQWVTLTYLLSTTLLVVPIGRLGDALGRRRVLLWGIGVFLVGAAAAVAAPSLGWLLAARVVQGAGAAAMLALPMALVRQSLPPARLGAVAGLLGAVTATGMALGPAVGGVVLGVASWRWVFVILAALGLGALGLCRVGLPAGAGGGAAGERFDWPGTALLGVALLAYPIAVTLQPGGAAGTVALLVIAAASGAQFVRRERAADAPLVDLAGGPAGLWPQLALALLTAVVMMGFMAVGPFYLTSAQGLTGVALGGALAVGPVAAALTGAPAGRLVDRWGTGKVATLGLLQLALGAVALAVLPPWLGLAGFLVGAVLLTPGNQLLMAANTVAIMRLMGPQAQGVASALLNLARNLGLITGAAVLITVYTSVARTAEGQGRTAAATLGMQAAFAVAAVVALAAAAIAGRVWSRSRRVAATPA